MRRSSLSFPAIALAAAVTLLTMCQQGRAQYIGDRDMWSPAYGIPGTFYAAFGQCAYDRGGFGYVRWGWGWGMRCFWGTYPTYGCADWFYSEPYYYSAPAYVEYFPSAQVISATAVTSNVAPLPTRTDKATVQVLLPANAELWIDGNKITQTGSVGGLFWSIHEMQVFAAGNAAAK